MDHARKKNDMMDAEFQIYIHHDFLFWRFYAIADHAFEGGIVRSQ